MSAALGNLSKLNCTRLHENCARLHDISVLFTCLLVYLFTCLLKIVLILLLFYGFIVALLRGKPPNLCKVMDKYHKAQTLLRRKGRLSYTCRAGGTREMLKLARLQWRARRRAGIKCRFFVPVCAEKRHIAKYLIKFAS